MDKKKGLDFAEALYGFVEAIVLDAMVKLKPSEIERKSFPAQIPPKDGKKSKAGKKPKASKKPRLFKSEEVLKLLSRQDKITPEEFVKHTTSGGNLNARRLRCAKQMLWRMAAQGLITANGNKYNRWYSARKRVAVSRRMPAQVAPAVAPPTVEVKPPKEALAVS